MPPRSDRPRTRRRTRASVHGQARDGPEVGARATADSDPERASRSPSQAGNQAAGQAVGQLRVSTGGQGTAEASAPAVGEQPAAAAPAPTAPVQREDEIELAGSMADLGDPPAPASGIASAAIRLPPARTPPSFAPRSGTFRVAQPASVLSQTQPPAATPDQGLEAASSKALATAHLESVTGDARRHHNDVGTLGLQQRRRLDRAYFSATTNFARSVQQASATIDRSLHESWSTLDAGREATDRAILIRHAMAKRALLASAADARVAISHNSTTATAQIEAILTELSQGFVEVLSTNKLACDSSASAARDAIQMWQGSYAVSMAPASEDREGYQHAVTWEAKSKLAQGLAPPELIELERVWGAVTSHFERNLVNVETSIDNRVGPSLRGYAVGIAEHGSNNVNSALLRAVKSLDQQARQARKTNVESHDQAAKQLQTTYTTSREQLEQEAGRELGALHDATDAASDGLEAAVEATLPSYQHTTELLAGALAEAAATGPNELAEAAAVARNALLDTRVLHAEQLDFIASGAEQSLKPARRDWAQRVTQPAAEAAGALRRTADQSVLDMHATMAALTDGFVFLTNSIDAVVQQWATPFATRFADLIETQRQELTTDVPRFTAAVEGATAEFNRWAVPRQDPESHFSEPLNAAAKNAWEHVYVKAVPGLKKAFENGFWDSIDEEGLGDAVRGLTALQGRAVRVVWKERFTKHGRLDQYMLMRRPFIRRDAYNAVLAGLRGDHVEQAKFELRDSRGVFNDDEARIERVMRSLSPEEMKELHQLDGGEELADARDALGGTDLKVFDALARSDYFGADAIKATRELNRQRARGNADAVGKLFEKYAGEGPAANYGGRSVSAADRRTGFVHAMAELNGQDLSEEAATLRAADDAEAGERMMSHAPEPEPTAPDSLMSEAPIMSEPAAELDPPVSLVSEPEPESLMSELEPEPERTGPSLPSDVLGRLSLDPEVVKDDAYYLRQAEAAWLIETATADMVRQRYRGGPGMHRSFAGGSYETVTNRFSAAQRDYVAGLVRHGADHVETRAAKVKVVIDAGGKPDIADIGELVIDGRFNRSLHPDLSGDEFARLVDQATTDRTKFFELFAERYGSAGTRADVEGGRIALQAQLRDAFGSDLRGGNLASRLVEYDEPGTGTEAATRRAEVNALAMQYSIEGVGTNKRLALQTLGRQSRSEITRIEVEYWKLTRRSLQADMGLWGQGGFGDFSGEERLEAERAYRGVPQNDRERAEAAAYAIEQRLHETSWLGGLLASGSLAEADLDFQRAHLREITGADVTFVNGRAIWGSDGSFDINNKFTGNSIDFAATTAAAKNAADDYSARIDQFANLASGAIAIIGVIAGTVATVVTFGAATPLLLAGIAAAAGVTSVATKWAIKGGTYGWEQGAADLGMAAVEAATAGLAQKLTLASKGFKSARAAQEAAKRAATETAESGVKSTVASELTHLTGSAFGDKMAISAATSALSSGGQTMLDERTWAKGGADAVGNIFAGIFKGVVSSGVTAGVSHRLDGVLGDTLSSGIGDAAGKVTELGIDSARGEYTGDAGDITTEAVLSFLRSAGQSTVNTAAGSIAENYRDRRAAAKSSATDAPDGNEPVDRALAPAPEVESGRPVPRTPAGPEDEIDLGLPKNSHLIEEIDGVDVRRPYEGSDGLIDFDHPRNRFLLEDSFAGALPGEQARDPVESRRFFEGFVNAQPEIEAALLRNTVTGEHIVAQGGPGSVDIREGHGAWEAIIPNAAAGVGRWEMLVHSHPVDPRTGVTLEAARVASGANGDFAWVVYEAQVTGRPATQEIHVTTETGSDVTRYGYDDTRDQRYWIDYPSSAGTRVVERFATMDDYHEWFAARFGGDMGEVPATFPGHKRADLETEPADTHPSRPPNAPRATNPPEHGTPPETAELTSPAEPPHPFAALPAPDVITPDTLVWVNTRSGRFHIQGSSHFRNGTLEGVLSTVAEAESAGYHQAGTPVSSGSNVTMDAHAERGEPRYVFTGRVSTTKGARGAQNVIPAASEFVPPAGAESTAAGRRQLEVAASVADTHRMHPAARDLGFTPLGGYRHGPNYINTVWDRHIERYIKQLDRGTRASDEIWMSTETYTVPGSLRLRSKTYRVWAQDSRTGDQMSLFEITLDVPWSEWQAKPSSQPRPIITAFVNEAQIGNLSGFTGRAVGHTP